MYSFDEYLLNTFSLISCFLHETPSTRQAFLQKVQLKKRNLWSTRPENAAYHIHLWRQKYCMHISILKALRSPAVKKPFQCCLTWNFPNLPDHRTLFFTLDTYFHPEKVLLKGTQRKHCLIPK